MLVQESSWGHTTLAAPSACTAGVIRRYFQTGKMPEGACGGDGRPFFDAFNTEECGIKRDEKIKEEGKDGDEEQLMRRAMWKLGEDWRW